MHLGVVVSVLLFVVLAVVVDTKKTKGVTHVDDVKALAELRELVIKSGVDLEGWNETDLDPCGEPVCGVRNFGGLCNWQGIACIDDKDSQDVGRIISIEIAGLSGGPKLEGELPSMLPSELISISLPDNSLSGKVAEISCLPYCHDRWHDYTKLRVINLENNNITGKLPKWKRLENLETVRLQNNMLTGHLPDMWAKKENLEEVDLSGNQLTGELPRSWSDLSSLVELKLSGNMLRKSIPREWFKMETLRVLNVTDNCAMCGDVPPEHDFRILAERTNLNKPCSSCNGCDCGGRSWHVIFKNFLYSLYALLGFFALYLMKRFLGRRCGSQPADNPDQTNIQQHFFSDISKVEMPTLIVMPDGKEICMGKKLEEDTVVSDDESSIQFISTDNDESSSEEDPDECNEGKIEDDPRLMRLLDEPQSTQNYRPGDYAEETDSVVYSSATSGLDSYDDEGSDEDYDGGETSDRVGWRGSTYSHDMLGPDELNEKFPDPPSGPPREPGAMVSALMSQDSASLSFHQRKLLQRKTGRRRSSSEIPDIFPEPPVGPPQRSAASCEYNTSCSLNNYQSSSLDGKNPPGKDGEKMNSGRRTQVPELSLREIHTGQYQTQQSQPQWSFALNLAGVSNERHPRITKFSPRESVPSKWPSFKRKRNALRKRSQHEGSSIPSGESSSCTGSSQLASATDGTTSHSIDDHTKQILLTSTAAVNTFQPVQLSGKPGGSSGSGSIRQA